MVLRAGPDAVVDCTPERSLFIRMCLASRVRTFVQAVDVLLGKGNIGDRVVSGWRGGTVGLSVAKMLGAQGKNVTVVDQTELGQRDAERNFFDSAGGSCSIRNPVLPSLTVAGGIRTWRLC